MYIYIYIYIYIYPHIYDSFWRARACVCVYYRRYQIILRVKHFMRKSGAV